MPVYIFEPDAFDKIIEVEGEMFREHRSKFGYCSFETFLKEWNKSYAPYPDRKNFRPEFGIDSKRADGTVGSGAIYGLGGWDRYTVLNSGEIAFIRYFTLNQERLQKAKEIGFRIW